MSPLDACMRQLGGLEHSSCSNLQVSMPAPVSSASLDLKAEAFQAVAHGELWLRKLTGCGKRGKKQAEGSLIFLVSYMSLLLEEFHRNTWSRAAHDFKFRQPLGTGFSPQDSDKSSPSLFCKAELEELGGSGFRQTSWWFTHEKLSGLPERSPTKGTEESV